MAEEEIGLADKAVDQVELSREDFNREIIISEQPDFALSDFVSSHGLILLPDFGKNRELSRVDYSHLTDNIGRSNVWKGKTRHEMKLKAEEVLTKSGSIFRADDVVLLLLRNALFYQNPEDADVIFQKSSSKQERIGKFLVFLRMSTYLSAVRHVARLGVSQFWLTIKQGRADQDVFMLFYLMHCLTHDSGVSSFDVMVKRAFCVVKSDEMCDGYTDASIQTEELFITTRERTNKLANYFFTLADEGEYHSELAEFYQTASARSGRSLEDLCSIVNYTFDTSHCVAYPVEKVNDMLGVGLTFPL